VSDPLIGRAPTPSDPESWDLAGSERLAASAIAGAVLAEMADTDHDIVVLRQT